MKNTTTYDDHAHFRVPADFMPMVHQVARSKGTTAASFMRMAVIEALHKNGMHNDRE